MVNKMSTVGAERIWRRMGARSALEAKGVIKNRLRRSIGITATRAAARLKIDRLGIALGDGAKAAQRRGAARAKNRTWGFEYSQRFGPKGAFTGRAQF